VTITISKRAVAVLAGLVLVGVVAGAAYLYGHSRGEDEVRDGNVVVSAPAFRLHDAREREMLARACVLASRLRGAATGRRLGPVPAPDNPCSYEDGPYSDLHGHDDWLTRAIAFLCGKLSAATDPDISGGDNCVSDMNDLPGRD
jgi:hypothetical protein